MVVEMPEIEYAESDNYGLTAFTARFQVSACLLSGRFDY